MDQPKPRIVSLRPSQATKEQLANFRRLLIRSGEVAAAGLDGRIARAEWLCFLFDGQGTLCGVAALKNPNETYRIEVFRKAGVPELAIKYPFELGWVYVTESMRNRGYSKLLIRKLLLKAGDANIYATTRDGNDAMIRVLTGRGFDRVGDSYRSDRRETSIVLMTFPPHRV